MAPVDVRQLRRSAVADVLEMPLKILGVNHRTAPVELREKVAFNPDQLAEALRHLMTLPKVEEVVIVSTCNRTELYGDYLDGGVGQAREWLMDYHRLQGSLDDCLYTFDNNRAVSHAFSVACGLDSAILGEPQILGQMKACYQQASDAGTLDSLVNRLFQHTFQVAKQVRTDTAIGASPVSVAFAAVSLARQIFGEFRNHTALLIGAGETIELTARHLQRRGISRMIIANRSVEKAEAIVERFERLGQVQCTAFDAIPEMGVFLRTRVDDLRAVVLPRVVVTAALALVLRSERLQAAASEQCQQRDRHDRHLPFGIEG